MTSVNFDHAFDRWYKATEAEKKRLDAEKNEGRAILSWEALDHLCGLAVESGMKALMLKEKMVTGDASGDFPQGSDGRRPHVNKLWDLFMTKATGHKRAEWAQRLGTVKVFQTWRTENRYAPDGTVQESELGGWCQTHRSTEFEPPRRQERQEDRDFSTPILATLAPWRFLSRSTPAT